MIKKIKSLLFFILTLTSLSLSAVDLSKVNFEYLYNTASPFSLMSKLALSDDGNLLLYMESNASDTYPIRFLTQPSFREKQHDEVFPIMTDTLKKANTVMRYVFRVEDLSKYLIIEASLPQKVFYFPTEVEADRLPKFLLETGNPLLTNYAVGTPRVQSRNKVFAYGYLPNFGLADPPYGNMKALSPVVEIDTLFEYTDEVELKDRMFYFLQQDTTGAVGTGFLKCPPYYPRYRRIEELIRPLEYMCSRRKFLAIKESANPRKSFQEFWKKAAGNEDKAKRAIRKFYRKVAVVNTLFTSYKPGWQTDQGMIYLVYGKPDSVQRTERKEIWAYKNKLSFEFVKISTLFAPSLYTLVRDPQYKNSWTPRIKALRAGWH